MCRPDIPTESSKSRALQGTADRVIIFDWDDTICPSTFVNKVANVATYKDLSRHFQNIFDELCKCAEKVLTEASKHGEVRNNNFKLLLNLKRNENRCDAML